MKNKKVILIVIILLIVLVFGYIFFIKKVDNTGKYSCPVAKYIIASGTLVTDSMIEYKNFDDNTNFLCDKDMIIGKCIKNNTMVSKDNRFKSSDLVNCGE